MKLTYKSGTLPDCSDPRSCPLNIRPLITDERNDVVFPSSVSASVVFDAPLKRFYVNKGKEMRLWAKRHLKQLADIGKVCVDVFAVVGMSFVLLREKLII